jgi:thiol-disulfide isomerase/thioredoxin
LAFATKTYTVTIKLQEKINFDKFKIYVDDGISQKLIEIKDTQSLRITIKGKYYSEYAMIKLTYPIEGRIEGRITTFFENRFFVKEQPAIIILKNENKGGSPFGKYSLINAVDFKKEKDSLNDYIAGEQQQLESFRLLHDKELNDGNDTTVLNEEYRLNVLILKKEVEYVLKNGHSYYSLVYFRRNLLNVFPADSMLQIFNKAFSAKLKNSEEGNIIKKCLAGKLSVRLNSIAPDFSTVDIKGDKISLSSFRNKKYVLLTFWATWCAPCRAEIPKIKSFNDTYSPHLQIISIAFPSTYPVYLNAVKEHEMNWVNIYDDAVLINDYGSPNGIPRIYLLDKSGKIIYANDSEQNVDSDLKKLERTLSDLLR